MIKPLPADCCPDTRSIGGGIGGSLRAHVNAHRVKKWVKSRGKKACLQRTEPRPGCVLFHGSLSNLSASCVFACRLITSALI